GRYALPGHSREEGIGQVVPFERQLLEGRRHASPCRGEIEDSWCFRELDDAERRKAAKRAQGQRDGSPGGEVVVALNRQVREGRQRGERRQVDDGVVDKD